MRIDVDISQHQLTWPQLRDRAPMCEEMGFEGAWVFDHFKALYGDPRGRDASQIVRSTTLSLSEPWDEVRRHAEARRRAGFSILIASWPSEGQGRIEEFARELLPELSAL